MPDFTHLHVHSHYSLLDGLPKIDQLLDHVQKAGMDAVALTDHGVMYGLIEFYQKAKKRGLKPILGMEAYTAPNGMTQKRPNIDKKNYHLTLLAQNNTGYKNLIKLATKAHLQGFYYKPRVDDELLKKHHQGIIALSGCIKGEIPQLIISNQFEKAQKKVQKYAQIFGKHNFFLEIQHHPGLRHQDKANKGLKKIAKKTGLDLVATHDSHYLKPEEAETQDILLAIGTQNTVNDTDRLTMKGADFSVPPPEKMASFFKHNPEAIKNTQKIKERCNVTFNFDATHLPKYDLPEGETPYMHLEKLTKKGVKKRFENDERMKSSQFKNKVKERLSHELSIIKKTGFASYFLIVQDFVNWAKDNGIVVGPGRGSAAGSLVSYALNITNVDPLEHNLIFERFLNPERVSMPDIDIDFADNRRDEVIEYARKKYGRDHVAQIITFGTMAARQAVRDTGRALDYSYDFCDRVAKMIPFGCSLTEALKQVPELRQRYKAEEKVKKLIDFSKKLEGVVRHASTHACGVVITEKPLTHYVPLQHASRDDKTIVTQYEMHAVEDLGLLKMDFLGLKNLTIIENTRNIIQNTQHTQIDLDAIPGDDKKTFKIFKQGETTGVFQFESRGMKRYLKRLEPTKFEDIVAMVALYRPGPMELIPKYIRRKQGKEKVTYVHPQLESILKSTYGIAVYQEQLIEIARQLAGFSYSEADTLRKAIGKKIKSLLEKQRDKLIQGMQNQGIAKNKARQIWKFIEPFARYGFNLAHAASYATIAYQTAYLKANYPVEFMAALLTAESSNTDKISSLVDEARRMEIEVLPPDVNESLQNFTVSNLEPPQIRFGLSAIKNVGENVVAEIIKNRKKQGPFSSITDFVHRITHKDLNKKSLESLIKAGAFDKLEERNKLLHNLEVLLAASRQATRQKENAQASLFGQKKEGLKISLKDHKPASEKQKLSWEKELLGLYISADPLENYTDQLKKKKTQPIPEIDPDKQRGARVGGIISDITRIRTRNGNPMLFVTVEDFRDKIELVVFPKILRKKPAVWTEDAVIVAEGKIDLRDDRLKLVVEKAERVDD